MARQFIEGFELGDLKLWDIVVGATLATGVADMTGTYCLNLGGSDRYFVQRTPEAWSAATKTEMYLALKVKTKAALQFIPFGFGLDNGEWVFPFGYTDAKNYLYRAGTLLHSSDAIYSLNTKYLMEAYIKLGAADGKFVLKLDGLTKVNYTGNTKGTATRITNIRHGYCNVFNNGYGNCYVDDVILDDAGWVGETFVAGAVASENGDLVEWTPSAGNAYECVGEIPPDDADYLSVNATDQTALFKFPDPAALVKQVRCVQLQYKGFREGNPTPTKIAPVLKTNGSVYAGTGQGPAYAPGMQHARIWETNPDTGIAFTPSEINDLQIGVKSAA